MHCHVKHFGENQKCFIFLLCLVLIKFPSEQNAEFTVQKKSPNTTVVAKGEPLTLNVTFSGAEENIPMLVFIEWYFHLNSSTSIKRVLSLTWDRGSLVSNLYYDVRASVVDNSSLMLVNTTFSDGGKYSCNTFSLPKSVRYPALYFNVIVEGEPKAKITCSQRIDLTVGSNFSCWCDAYGVHMVPMASWIKSGQIIADRTRLRQKLSLNNISTDAAGTYVCRAQLFSMVDEKATKIMVYSPPKISSFRLTISQRDTITLTCLAVGSPKLTYTIEVSDGTVLAGSSRGKVTIRNYESIINASYICIARNAFGEDKKKLNGYIPHLIEAKTTPKLQSNKHEIQWYVILVSVILGIICGCTVLYGCQWLREKKTPPTEQSTQEAYDIPIYIDPATISISKLEKKQFADTPIYVNPATSNSVKSYDGAIYVNSAATSNSAKSYDGVNYVDSAATSNSVKSYEDAIYVDSAAMATPAPKKQQIESTCFDTESVTLPKSAPDYEDLDSEREDEEHHYQSLTVDDK